MNRSTKTMSVYRATKSNKSIFLSHFLDNETPCYGGRSNIIISKSSRIETGSSSNSLNISINNHVGTHIDLPRHFLNTGKSLNDYSPEFWVFNQVSIIYYQAKNNEIISEKDLDLSKTPQKTDLVIIRTDFQSFRESKVYWNDNPGLAPDLAGELKRKFPELRAIGFDFISLSPYKNRELGRMSHKSFLVENDILVVEDMKLDCLNFTPSEVVICPLLISDADGVPVTVIAFNE